MSTPPRVTQTDADAGQGPHPLIATTYSLAFYRALERLTADLEDEKRRVRRRRTASVGPHPPKPRLAVRPNPRGEVGRESVSPSSPPSSPACAHDDAREDCVTCRRQE